MALIPLISERRTPSQPTTTPAPMPVDCSERRKGRDDQARKIEAERKLTADQWNGDNGLADLGRSDNAAGDQKQHLRTQSALHLFRPRFVDRLRICGKPNVAHWASLAVVSGWQRRDTKTRRLLR
jgi:hypothetical protein